MTCHGESCHQGRRPCTERCNPGYDSDAEIVARLPLLVLCTVLGCISFAVSAYVLLGDSGLTYALAKLARTLFSLT